jgi:hypothetical protein
MAAIEAALANPAFVHQGPECFGPALWASIHTIIRAFQPTPAGQVALRAYMTALGELFPCARCAEHVRAAVKTMPTHSTAAALQWSVDFHNDVNARIGKPVLTYEQAVAAMSRCSGGYSGGNGEGDATQWTTLAKVLLPLLAVAVIGCIVLGALLSTKGSRTTGPEVPL